MFFMVVNKGSDLFRFFEFLLSSLPLPLPLPLSLMARILMFLFAVALEGVVAEDVDLLVGVYYIFCNCSVLIALIMYHVQY